jgi:hypothetical protein
MIGGYFIFNPENGTGLSLIHGALVILKPGKLPRIV